MNAKHIVIDRRKILTGMAVLPLVAALPGRLRAEDKAEQSEAPEIVLEPDARGLLPDDHMLGSPDAPTVLIEYASLSCPHCAHFQETVFPELQKNWIEAGKLLYVFRDFPLNAPALWAAMLAQCLEGDAYFAFVDMVFREQRNWLTAEDPGAKLFELSQLAGFDKARFESCISNEDTFNRMVAGIQHAEKVYDVDATPTLILNGEKVQPSNYEELSGLIAESQGS